MSVVGYERGSIRKSPPRRRISPPAEALSLFQVLTDGLSRLDHWLERRRSRRHLMELSDELLLDIGLTRPEARAEASKSFHWDRVA